ncbi:hypothetical protein [Streptomyces sp. PSAA01]|uniref:hypothetical protein n=1 Tax=Streptomyces sp. PSAA01 TaxID=2912762 RepID=UPI001F169496|nr:hypothetical protein [Streptomyces sp. PSAA01]MCG0285527.1 hypothetical protein [Streptomyces sp. PSAA01]
MGTTNRSLQADVLAETILINTGSEPIVLDIPGLRSSQYTSPRASWWTRASRS